MASTKTHPVLWLEQLGDAQLAQLQALVAASGWNQLDADWQVFFQHGKIAVCHDVQGRIMASGAVLPLGPQLAWISMILALPQARGQGLGGSLFLACLQEARQGERTACLDATPQGERLYLHHGFAPTEPLKHLTRWKREALPGAPQPHASTAGLHATAVRTLAALDAEALGAPRHALLANLLARPGTRCVRTDQAWALVRQGRVAQHIGPILAVDDASAMAVLQRSLQGLAGPAFIDVPHHRPAFTQALAQAGFAPQRDFTRMALGDAPPQGQAHYLYAIAGPEYG